MLIDEVTVRESSRPNKRYVFSKLTFDAGNATAETAESAEEEEGDSEIEDGE